MSYRPRHFALQELVDPVTFNELGNEAWAKLDPEALQFLDALRDQFGPVTVNSWHYGGRFKESGLRRQSTTTGAPKSAHKLGKAFDCKFRDKTIPEVFEYIMSNQIEFPTIRRIEDIRHTPTWLHCDTVEHPGSGIKVFIP